MNVTCPNCSTIYRVDPAKVPSAGVRARCAVCAAIFPVRAEGAIAAPPPEPMLAAAPSAERVPAPAAPAAPAAPVAPAVPAVPAAPVAPAPVPPAPVAAAPVAEAPSAEPAPLPLAAPAPAAPPMAPPAAGPARPAAAGAPPRPASPTGMPRPAGVPPRPSLLATRPDGPGAMRPAAPPSEAPPREAPPRRAGNPFLSQDPSQKARRLARALISDMVVYHPAKRREGLRDGNLKELFDEEIKKSWEEFTDQVGRDLAESTSHFKDALNEILADGRQLF